ncbi:sigma-E factor negative regulatory protein [Lysobacter sp. A6]|uniref:Sigma-E factor negative regulatory protein n=1 Tax=Noviluteimonas lactosilytica TaxID=2888523 RepID=A0ABS8JEM0_9GAMM|nr:sigma-E factor negative regulatory protein [Lysobacter lactosilyticus]MCC8362033.1 sigma-E factor negative regulatory protein [Lysobacter lactosilyticus]
MNTTHNSHPPGSSHPASDREALSALFDGELVGDAARFALKRLDHDQAWRDSCERWQRIGDALRGQGASASFPQRVHDAVRADAMRSDVANHAAPAVQQRRQFRWGSVGLAASAALVAFFLARMPMSGGEATSDVQVATAPATQQPAQAPAQAPSAPDPDLQQATAAVAAVAAARPMTERIAQRSRNVERGRAATDRIVGTAVAANDAPITGEVAQPVRMVANGAPEATTSVALDTPAQTAAGGAFTPATVTRQWPRAVLPQLGGSGAVAADYTSAGPTFYPFTPPPSLEPADAANDDTPPPQP